MILKLIVSRMDYSRWTNCPPRAPLAKPDAVYGSFDHIILLLGRIAEFASRDRKRKLKAMEANGGVWKPPPGMPLGPPGGPPRPPGPPGAPSMQAEAGMGGQMPQKMTQLPMNGQSMASQQGQHPPGPRGPPQMPPQMPTFYGMAPPPRRTSMPSSYQPHLQQSHTPHAYTHSNHFAPHAQTDPPYDLRTATKEAEAEWGALRAALHKLETLLLAAPTFQALRPEHHPPVDSPFGHALLYRSYDISCLWLIVHMASIICLRSAPGMPPAAHMAAGFAAQQTAHHAQSIGRIAAGVFPPPQHQPLSPSLGAAMCECSVPLFFAGVQYRDPAQREWTVRRLFDVDLKCGWATAGVIAEGCQTSWVKAAAMGRGPPWERIRRERMTDERGSGEQGGMVVGEAGVGEDSERDRRFVHSKALTRLHWGIGIIGMEEDLWES